MDTRDGAKLRDLRQLLNDWDFLGVGDFSAYEDEYDCLLGPLAAMLLDGAKADEVRTYLRERLQDHFGVDPDHLDIAEFVDRIIGWRTCSRTHK